MAIHLGTKKLFLHVLDPTILNSYIILSSCDSQIDHRKLSGFGSKFVRNEFKVASSSTTPSWRQTHKPVTWQTEGWWFKQWPVAGSHFLCHICVAKQKRSTTKFQYKRCKVVLCLHPCFRIYHTKLHLWNTGPLHCGKRRTSRNVSAIHFITIDFYFWNL
jgi:hypothetical protein